MLGIGLTVGVGFGSDVGLSGGVGLGSDVGLSGGTLVGLGSNVGGIDDVGDGFGFTVGGICTVDVGALPPVSTSHAHKAKHSITTPNIDITRNILFMFE